MHDSSPILPKRLWTERWTCLARGRREVAPIPASLRSSLGAGEPTAVASAVT